MSLDFQGIELEAMEAFGVNGGGAITEKWEGFGER
jgi:hypothetical protein